MSEHHVHFIQPAIEKVPDDGPYGYQNKVTEQDRDEWRKMLVAQMEAAFASAKTLPVNPLRQISVSITVKQ